MDGFVAPEAAPALSWHDVHQAWFGSVEPDEVKLARLFADVQAHGFNDPTVIDELDEIVEVFS